MFGNLNIYIGRNVKQFKIIAPMKIKNFLWLIMVLQKKNKKLRKQKFLQNISKMVSFSWTMYENTSWYCKCISKFTN